MAQAQHPARGGKQDKLSGIRHEELWLTQEIWHVDGGLKCSWRRDDYRESVDNHCITVQVRRGTEDNGYRRLMPPPPP